MVANVERRRFRRIPAAVQVRVAFTGQSFRVESINLSAGGVLLDTGRRLPLGTHLLMRIDLPMLTKYPIRVEGEVVRNTQPDAPGMAVRFTQIDEEDRELLGELSQRPAFLLPP